VHNVSTEFGQGPNRPPQRAAIHNQEFSMVRRFFASVAIVAAVAGASLAATGMAEARDGRNGAFAAGAAAGVVGGALLGGALASPGYAEPVYEPAPVYVEPECYWTKQRVRNVYDYGTHWERVRVCN
jgi:hypothetical protein